MKDMFNLEGKVAVVTGASSGLGHDAAVMYAEYGADVALLDLNENDLEKVKEEIEKLGRKVIAIECDVTKETQVKDAVSKVLDVFSHIDILLNNAGVAVRGGVETLTEDEWDKSFNVNVKGMYLLSKYIIPGMKENMER